MIAETVLKRYQDEAVTLIDGTGPLRLFCEHGGNRVPEAWQQLGLTDDLLGTHYGFDIGARELTTAIAERTGAPAVIANYSRLFLDYNRSLDSWDACRPDLAGIPVPGNRTVDDAEKQLRWRVSGAPLRAALEAMLQEECILMTVHSFTRLWEGDVRDVDIGLTCAHDHAIIDKVSDYLETGAFAFSMRYGRDKPYVYDPTCTETIKFHTAASGQIGFQVEVCNDILSDPGGLLRVAELLAGIPQHCLDRPARSGAVSQ